jgi:hypothetical protein
MNDRLKDMTRVPLVEQWDGTTPTAKRPTCTGRVSVASTAAFEHHASVQVVQDKAYSLSVFCISVAEE